MLEVLLENGEPIDPDAIYSVVTNDFMRNGGDGYAVLAEDAIDPYDFGKPLDQIVADYIAANSPLEIGTDGRITATVGYAD
ncbi:MAG: 5'-nucleotidase C-terminal domain-containing protein [Anaerolineae bacterium]|nr:5'-nucleotidase C-terminal domain-containing protein [Anaerolineae bacterium]